MKFTFMSGFRLAGVALLSLIATTANLRAQGKELKFETQLVWATTNSVSPDPKHKPVEPGVKKKLDKLPLKWASYFEVNRRQFAVPAGGNSKSAVSEKCAIEVKDVDGKKIQVVWFGKKGDVVGKQTQPLAKGEILILGGNAPAATAWFIILKRIE